ncbi:MAG: transporter substrate-binding domain-containing protein, partial [Selenomonadaceae bacterium]|nr:transporter substrate-binding domain-containing protein [Selenomonadaceae bacterium]
GNEHLIRSEGDLVGKRVGTQAGSTSVCIVEGNPRLKDEFAEFKTYPNYGKALQALTDGEVDALIADELLSRYTVAKNPDKFKVVEVIIGSSCEIGIGFRKDDVELRDRVQRAFDDMVKDGTAKRISEKWFGANVIKFRK